MLTVFAISKIEGQYKALIDLPANGKQLRNFGKTLGTPDLTSNSISIRYAGTNVLWSLDLLLFENNFDGKNVTVDELNLLSYLLERMDEQQRIEFNDTMDEYTNDLGTPDVSTIINEAYDTITVSEGDCELAPFYDGENIRELIAAERKCLQPYETMNKDVFWDMIHKARAECGGDLQRMEDNLIKTVSFMSPLDIRLYKDINDEYIRLADKSGVYAAGSAINGRYCSDDGFLDFRGWLISQGKEVYMKTLKNPDSLADVDAVPLDGYYQWETFTYIASEAYEEHTGEDIYDCKPVITQEMKAEIAAEIEYANSIDVRKNREDLSEYVPNLYEKYVNRLSGPTMG